MQKLSIQNIPKISYVCFPLTGIVRLRLNSKLFIWKQKCEPVGTESEANILAIWSQAESNIWVPKLSWGKFMNIFPTKVVDQV